MDRFAALTAFVATVDHGGFAAAARALGTSRSAVNRHVIALEEELGARLLNRTTRSVAPTATGQAFHERAVAILQELTEAERAVARDDGEPAGSLRINAPMSFGTLHLAPAVTAFMTHHPQVRIELRLDDRHIDPVSEGFDLTVRIAEPDERSGLVDHRIVEIKRVICASPAHLERHGAPRHPSELRTRPCLHYGNLASGNFWRLDGPDGAAGVHVNGVLCSNNAEILREAATAGLGIALLPTFIAGGELQAGRLVSVLADYAPPQLFLCAVYPPGRHLSAKVRLFVDFLTERFGDRPYWDLVS